MGFIYQEANAYGVEALVALERHYTPTEEKYCTAVTEAVRICDTYGIPERELVPQVRHIAAAEEYLLEHLSEDEETLQFLFTPLSGSNTCLAWFLVWDYVRPGGEKAYKYTGHTPQQRLRDIISAVGQYQEDPLPPPQQLDTICDLIDYMDLTRLPPADRWRLLTLYAHLEEYERTARMLAEELGVVPSERMLEQFREMSGHISSRPGVIEEIKEGLQEKQKEKGAYFCTLPSFRDVYRMVRRNMERSGQSVYLLACSLTDSRGQALERGEKLDTLTEGLDEAIRESLRSGDAYTRYSASQYLVMLTGISRENCRLVIERITDSFTKEHKSWVKRLHCCVTSLYDEEG